MATSSNYKTYARQPRALTEETQFAGGMLWSGNHIDATHLRTIINFDYDDTTGFLKVRDPLLPEYSTNCDPATADCIHLAEGSEYYDYKSAQLINAFNICPEYKNESNQLTLDEAGWLYLFGDIQYDAENKIYTCQKESIIGLFHSSNDEWFQCSNVLDLYDTGDMLRDSVGLKGAIYDNTIYFINDASIAAYSAFRIYKEETSIGEPPTYYLCEQPFEYDAMSDDKNYIVFENGYKDLTNNITTLESTVSGYNALKENPYTTNPESEGRSVYEKTYDKILSVFMTEHGKNMPVVSPRIGQNMDLHMFFRMPSGFNSTPIMGHWYPTDSVYSDGRTYPYVKVYYTTESNPSDNTVWTPLASSIDLIGYAGSPATLCGTDMLIYTDFVAAKSEITTYKIELYDSVAKVTNPAQLYVVDSIIFSVKANKLNPIPLKDYKVETFTGQCLWNNRMCFWGARESLNTIFLTEVDNFYYIPIPNNLAVFDTDVISCVPYKGDLLVFTTNRIYKLTQTADAGFMQSVVMNDMPIAYEDAPYIRTIKNMVLFKSGKYFFMLVPKSQSITGELTVAPIYKNIAQFFKDLDTTEILMQLYPDREYINVNNVSIQDIYIEQDTVTILYSGTANYRRAYEHTLEYSNVQNYALFVNYNTNLRAWTLYFEDTTDKNLFPAALTAARLHNFIRVDSNNNITIESMQLTDDISKGVIGLIDTGYRTLSGSLKKRFRELQLKLYSKSENITQFGSAFFIDGQTRRSYSKLEVVYDSDSKCLLSPVYDPNTFITESTMTIDKFGKLCYNNDSGARELEGSDRIELSDWFLDFSHFKKDAPTTIRIPVSGKGYYPRCIFYSKQCLNFSINEINWVYRMMYGR